jgi:hypothetical protein
MKTEELLRERAKLSVNNESNKGHPFIENFNESFYIFNIDYILIQLLLPLTQTPAIIDH